MSRIAVINQKGGVGKTTTTANLGAGLALFGYKVLLIDLDPQANLTSHLEFQPYQTSLSSYELMRDRASVADLAQATAIPNLYLIPSGGDLAAAEVELAAEFGRESILRKQLDRAERAGAESAYDYILIDCPPSLGLLAVNALTAADEALVPIQAEFFALAGIAKFVDLHRLVQDRLNADLRLSGIVICMWKGHANLSHEVRDDVRSMFGDILYEAMIRQNVKLAEAPSQGRTIFEYAPDSNGSVDYEALTREFLVRHHESVPDEMDLPPAAVPDSAAPAEQDAGPPDDPSAADGDRFSDQAPLPALLDPRVSITGSDAADTADLGQVATVPVLPTTTAVEGGSDSASIERASAVVPVCEGAATDTTPEVPTGDIDGCGESCRDHEVRVELPALVEPVDSVPVPQDSAAEGTRGIRAPLPSAPWVVAERGPGEEQSQADPPTADLLRWDPEESVPFPPPVFAAWTWLRLGNPDSSRKPRNAIADESGDVDSSGSVSTGGSAA